MDKIDVLIVGGGITGLSVAVTLCVESKLAIALVEKKSIGANSTTPVVFPELLHNMGLGDCLLQDYNTYVLQSPLGSLARYEYNHRALASLNYQKASLTLFEKASNNGLRFINDKAVDWSPIIPEPEKSIVVNLESGLRIKSQVLIDASGYIQWAARHLNISLSPYYSICYGEFLNGCSFKEKDTFYFFAPNSKYGNGGGWFYPIKENQASIGYAQVSRSPHHPDKHVKEGFLAAKTEFQPFSNWVKGATIKKVESGIIPVGRIGRFCDNRILIVGDAAGQTPPWCMMGVNSGLKNGLLCAKAVLDAFSHDKFNRATFTALYERIWNKSNRESFWRTLSHFDKTWVQRTDEDWDKLVYAYNKIPAGKQLELWKYNSVPLFQKLYAVSGYLRRQFFKK